MKKLNLLLMMFASLTLLFATSCGKNDEPDTPEKKIALAVSGGADVVIDGADVIKDITVTASEKATQDIVVSLSISNAAEGEATLESPTITIKEGETSATGKITFAAAKFPKDTPQKKITVNIASSTENVEIGVGSTDFKVSGIGGAEMPKLTITANGTEFNTTEAAKEFKITFTLSAELTEELPVTITWGEGTTDAFKAEQIPAFKIAAGSTADSFVYTVDKGVAGKVVFNFAIENEEVSLETTTLSATFTVDVPEITPLCAIEKLNNTWWQLAGFTVGDKTITIPADAPAYQNMLAETIANVKGGDMIKIGAMSKDGEQSFFCHAWVDWNNDNNVTADEMVGSTVNRKKVSEGTPDPDFLTFVLEAPEGTPAGTYHMRIGTNYKDGLSGCANTGADESRTAYDLTINYTPGDGPAPTEDPTFSVVTSQTGDVIVPATGDKEITFQVKLSATAEEEQTINLAATSTGKNGTITPTSVVFAAGETSKDVKIKFLSSDFTSDAVSATVTVTATSQVLEATTGKDAIQFKVKGTAGPVSKQELNYYLESATAAVQFETAQDAGKTVSFYLKADSPDAAKQVGSVNVLATVTGDNVTAADYSIANSGVITITKAEAGNKKFDITINPSAAGKTLTITVSSDETTFQTKYISKSVVVTMKGASTGPQDFKIDSFFETEEAKPYNWFYIGFQTQEDTKGAPVNVTVTAKVNGADVTSELNISNPLSLEYNGDYSYKAMSMIIPLGWEGKTIVFTFESEESTFLPGKTTLSTTVVAAN